MAGRAWGQQQTENLTPSAAIVSSLFKSKQTKHPNQTKQYFNMSKFNFQRTEKIWTILKGLVQVITKVREKVKNKAFNTPATFHPSTNATDGYEERS